MKAEIVKAISLKEYLTPERCFISENLSSEKVSIARARVKPGVTTVAHHLVGVDEIYIITKGRGKVNVENLDPAGVTVGDMVAIPPGTSQRITNVGTTDLVFYCVCTPRFTAERYVDEERKANRHE
jgi:mannose-6-phosphate isomerase-like protein (cupin superfamily)